MSSHARSQVKTISVESRPCGGEGGVPARHGRPHELVDGVGADDAAAVARPLRRREVPPGVAPDRARA